MIETKPGIDEILLQILHQSQEPRSLADLLEQVESRDREFAPTAIREAIWRLIDRNEILLTKDRRLRAVA